MHKKECASDNGLAEEQKKDLSRRKMRSLVFHLLYSMESFDYDLSMEGLTDNFNRGFDLSIKPTEEIFEIAQAVVDSRTQLDAIFFPCLINWRPERLGTCTKLILRFAVWELYNRDTPSTIVINEAIELAKCFSEKDAHKFINGVLDEVVKQKKEKEEECNTPKESE